MAARKRPYNEAKLEVIRERIQMGVLLQRLSDHALGALEMTQTQIRAAEILLKKCMPDLTSVEHSGEIEHKRPTELTDDELISRINLLRTGNAGGVEAAQTGAEEPSRVH